MLVAMCHTVPTINVSIELKHYQQTLALHTALFELLRVFKRDPRTVICIHHCSFNATFYPAAAHTNIFLTDTNTGIAPLYWQQYEQCNCNNMYYQRV